jgi:hypothetical protein
MFEVAKAVRSAWRYLLRVAHVAHPRGRVQDGVISHGTRPVVVLRLSVSGAEQSLEQAARHKDKSHV